MIQSYGGHYGPEFAAYIQEQNAGIAGGSVSGENIHLVALGVNNGWIDPAIQEKAYIDFSYNNSYQQLIDDFGITHEELGQRIGRNRTTITNTIRLLKLTTPSAQVSLATITTNVSLLFSSAQKRDLTPTAKMRIALATTPLRDQLVAQVTGTSMISGNRRMIHIRLRHTRLISLILAL